MTGWRCEGVPENAKGILLQSAITLKVLFSGVVKPVRKFTEEEINHKADLMVALVDAEEDARPDDGTIECDNDDVYIP
ncbi:hypothetical protein B0H10DRAFT_2243543 [Mycena sp. CBHHK59/15]|nr:hypothetical protein B0H10DRAFT_2243543 [Mycena sp. CBHHK59/15]